MRNVSARSTLKLLYIYFGIALMRKDSGRVFVILFMIILMLSLFCFGGMIMHREKHTHALLILFF